MASRRLQTQTEEFWRDTYTVSDDDLNLATSQVLESGAPVPLEDLTASVVLTRFRQEREAAVRQVGRGHIYRPMDSFEPGQALVFSALDFAVGTVVDTRSGQNPKYGPFQVVRVGMETGQEREFAAGLDAEHPLNRPIEDLVADTDSDLDEKTMLRLFGGHVSARLSQALSEHQDFVPFGDLWFLDELLPEIHVGHLNLAEALIDQARKPLPSGNLLSELGLDLSGSEEAQVFALSRALRLDGRFDELGAPDGTAWFLRALEPASVAERPLLLRPAFRATGGEQIGITLLDIVEEIGDELDDVDAIASRPVTEIRTELAFPHLHSGTLPLSDQFRRLLPAGVEGHFPVTLVDSSSGETFSAWALPDRGYLGGFESWFAKVRMCVGGQIVLAPASEPLTYTLQVTRARSSRSDWVRSVTVVDDALDIQMQRASVGIRCDPNMYMDVPDAASVASLMVQMEDSGTSLPSLIGRAYQEISKLSSRGLVHIKSLYSLVNMMRRSGIVPICEFLTRSAAYDPLGDGFWAYDSALQGQIYDTADQMRERPSSTRPDMVRDQVVQYLGR